MTQDEAKQVVLVVATVDGGCGVCADKLLQQLVRAFPSVDWKRAAREADETLDEEGVRYGNMEGLL